MKRRMPSDKLNGLNAEGKKTVNKKVTFNIKGISPLLMHSPQTVDPLNPIARDMKQITKKRIKSDDDYGLLSRLEFFAGLYLSEDFAYEIKDGKIIVETDAKVVIPAGVLDGMIFASAKKVKMGTTFKSSVMAEDDAPLIFDGANDGIQALVDNPKYYDKRTERVNGGSGVIRTRPIFRTWSLTFGVLFNSEIVNYEDIGEAVKRAGTICGIGDRRPRFGRFELIAK